MEPGGLADPLLEEGEKNSETKIEVADTNAASDEKIEVATIDEMLQDWVGEFGWGQMLQFMLVSWSWVIDSQNILATIFTDQQVSWKCREGAGPNCSPAASICQMDPKFWEWVGGPGASTVSEWGLICGEEYKAGLSGSAFFLGCIIGAGIFGRLSDSILGRKRTLMLACLMAGIAGILTAMSPNYYIYLCFRVANGMARGGVGLSAVVLATEVVGSSMRGQIGLAAFYFFALGAGGLPVIAWFTQSWRKLYLAISIPSVLYSLLVLPFVSESPRWLLVKGRSEEALAVLRKMAKRNGKNMPETICLATELDSIATSNDIEFAVQGIHQKAKVSYSVSDVFRHSLTRCRMYITLFIWFCSAIIYYGISLNVVNLGANVYISSMLNGLSEAPAMAIATLVIKKLGRRLLFVYAALSCGVCCTLVSLLFPGGLLGASPDLIPLGVNQGAFYSLKISYQNGPDSPFQTGTLQTLFYALGSQGREQIMGIARVVIEVLGMFGSAVMVNLLYIYTAELFPTVVRNAALALNVQACQIGSVVAPLIVVLGHTNPSYPFMIFALVAFLAGLISLKLPETMHKSMSQTFEEMEEKEGSQTILR